MIREIFEGAVESSESFYLKASYSTAYDAVEYLEKHDADLVILDVLFPGSMSGLDAAEKIKKNKPETKIIIVTSMPELSYEKRAREIGVESFWQKEVQEQPILEIMDRTMKGESVYPSKRMEVKIGNARNTDFTERETEILRELVCGASNKDIADKLCVEISTVKMHISNMLQKTGYHTRLELAVKARNLGLVIND
ncbi:response regulator transcription factor [Butyrivibrio sp. WCD3002]|uniref:response regulator transcription factor n=1 Tax=Butyrivibrio sp. WCD3002 TaxID=1280676 RepID=UPI0003FD3C8C|nr:response regulator transcription factor [Butyrivibrio sp. WCD3002]